MRLTIPTRGVYSDTLMSTNKHITAHDRARLTAPPCVRNPRPLGVGFAYAHAIDAQVLGLHPTD